MQTAPAAADLGSVEALDEQISSFAGLASGDARRRNFHASSQGQAESLVLNAAPKAKYEANQTGIHGPALEDMFELPRRHMPSIDIVHFLDMVVLNVLA